MRQYRLIVGGIAVSVAIAALTAVFVPQPAGMIEDSGRKSISELFLYKGKPGADLMASRRGPWDQTVAVMKQHPWFGSGFGTSVTGRTVTYFELTRTRFVDSRMVREHGNSYLAIAEWSGLLGVVPFYLLVGAVALHAKKAIVQLRRTGNIFAPAVPAAAILIAGLIDAGFEDWLFAVGYYLAVFFWAMAFILADLVHSAPNLDEAEVVSATGQYGAPVMLAVPKTAFR